MQRNSRFGWLEGDLLIKQNPVTKGDFVGHPFRGNQHSDASGAGSAYDPASDKRTRLTENDLHFNPFSPEAQNESEQDRRDERIEHRANAQVAYQDATRANLMLLHSLRGVGVIEDTTYRYGDGVRFINVIRLGGFDTTMSTKTNNIIHHSRAAAEKQTKKVIAEMEQILSDPTLEVRALDENMWEYTFNHTLGNGTVRRATTRVKFRKPKDEADLAKGDPRMRLLKASTEAQFTLAPWYIPDKYDAQNEWTDAVELQKALWEYVKGGDREIRLQHNREIRAGEWVEAMTLPYEWSVPVHKANGEVGAHTYPKGTVLLGVVWDDWAWDMVKKGDITGFSIGGSAERIDLEMPT